MANDCTAVALQYHKYPPPLPPTAFQRLPVGLQQQVRHKLDDVFAQPKALCFFELVTPVAYESPRTVAALKLFEMSLDERLNEYTYDAQVWWRMPYNAQDNTPPPLPLG